MRFRFTCRNVLSSDVGSLWNPLHRCTLLDWSSWVVPGCFQNDPQPLWAEIIFLFCTCPVMILTLMSLRCSSSAQSRLYLQLFVWKVIKALAQVIGQCTIKDFATNYFKKESERELMYTHTHTQIYIHINNLFVIPIYNTWIFYVLWWYHCSLQIYISY